jgi:hypothetical protein
MNKLQTPQLTWRTINARIMQGHRVASGSNADPRFPGGTLQMQLPHFAALGFDLRAFHLGTLNVSIAPLRYRVKQAPQTFRGVKWHATEPAEDFSFFNLRLIRPQAPHLEGKIYYPHPDTKPTHFQSPDVLELLLPFVEGLKYGDTIQISVPTEQMHFDLSDEATSENGRPS